MRQYGKLTRGEILGDLDAFEGDPEFAHTRDSCMGLAVNSLDLELAQAMLRLGASPDGKDARGDGYLHDLYWQYLDSRTVKGEAILAMLELLLSAGGDPNRVGCNSYRAVDLAMQQGFTAFAGELISAGADAAERPFI